MATPSTFEERVEALTGIDIGGSTIPSNDDISYFIIDGIRDVAEKLRDTNPKALQLLAQTESVTAATGLEVNGNFVLDVSRLNGTPTGYRQARRVSRTEALRAMDPTSLHYATKHNPVYYIDNVGDDTLLFIKPDPSTGNDAGYVTHVKFEDVDDAVSPATLTYAKTGIGNMPSEYERLVVIYAALKALEAHMGYFNITEEDPEMAAALMVQYNALKTTYYESFGIGPKQQEAAKQ